MCVLNWVQLLEKAKAQIGVNAMSHGHYTTSELRLSYRKLYKFVYSLEIVFVIVVVKGYHGGLRNETDNVVFLSLLHWDTIMLADETWLLTKKRRGG